MEDNINEGVAAAVLDAETVNSFERLVIFTFSNPCLAFRFYLFYIIFVHRAKYRLIHCWQILRVEPLVIVRSYTS